MSTQDIFTLVSTGATIGTIVFFSGRLTQKVEDLSKAFKDADIPDIKERVTILEVKTGLKRLSKQLK